MVGEAEAVCCALLSICFYFFLYLLYFALFQNVVKNSDNDVKNIVSDVIMLTLWVLNVNIFSQSRYICNKVDRLI